MRCLVCRGDFEYFVIVRKWNNKAGDTDACKRWVISEFLSGAERDGFRLVPIKGETIFSEPRAQC